MIVFTVWLIWERINQIEAIRSGFWDNLAYTTSQADFEIVRLLDALAQVDQASSNDPSEDIFIRFEVALGRLIGLTEGNTGRRILANNEVRDTILSALERLEAIENDVLAYPRLPPEQQVVVVSTLRDISREFHAATVTIASLGDRDQTAFYQSLARAARFEILMLWLIAFAGALAFTNAFLERRRFTRLNRSLADTVAVRTAELEAQNSRLENEIAEHAQAELRFRTLVTHATEAIVIMDVAKGVLVEANPRAEALFGLPRDRLVNTYGPVELSPEFQHDGRRSDQAAMDYLDAALNGDFPTFEWVHKSIDGLEVPCSVSLARLPFGEQSLVRGSIVDLTEKKKAETVQRNLEQQLAQAQKLETIGQMTGGVAHDFNNLLSVILGNLEMLQDGNNDDDARESIEAAIKATLRGADLTRSMLAFARRANLQPEKFVLSDLLPEMDSWITRTIPANIRIERSFKPDPWPVQADRAGTESALLNLVINARDAMPEGGVLVVETENVEVPEIGESAGIGELDPGSYVMLAVSDTGQGIKAEDLPKVFEPFFSTKSPTNNSGLGLSMVHGFMKQSGGSVRVYSEPGVGTTVKLFFPASDTHQPTEKGSDLAKHDPAPTGRILVAEDQYDVLKVLVRSLEAQGHEVVASESGDAALLLFKEHATIDLLVTDVVMPGTLQGPGLAKELRRLDPDLPVVFMSGYASEATLHGNGLRDDDMRLMKPVSRNKLIEAVNAALKSRRA